MKTKERSRYLSRIFWRDAVADFRIRGLPRAALRRVKARLTKPKRVRAECVDLTSRTADPIEAISLAIQTGATPVIRVPLAALRHKRLGIRIDDVVTNPFTRTVAEYLSGECTTYTESTLWRYYQAWQPASLAEFVGLEVADDRSHLALPLAAIVLPWKHGGDGAKLSVWRETHERRWTLNSSSCGPTSDSYGEHRFGWHCEVAASIAELASARGIAGDTWWVPDQGGYVEVQILAAGDSWAGLVSDDKHRTTALGAVGAKDLLVSLPSHYPVVRREDVASWPAVCSGLYTAEQALEVFDRFLAGTPPNGFPELGRSGLS
jgi:hypothetical protein